MSAFITRHLRTTAPLAALGLCVFLSTSNLFAIVIDHFDDPDPGQELETEGGVTESAESSFPPVPPDPNILGGERDVALTQGPTGSASIVVNPGGQSSFAIVSNATAMASARIQWDGEDGSMALDPEGLGTNLMAGGDNAFEFGVQFNDHLLDLTFTVWTDATHFSTHPAFTVPKGIIDPDKLANPEKFSVLYADFVPGGGAVGPADFGDVGAIELLIAGSGQQDDAIDVLLDFVSTANSPANGVPEPSTLVLLLGGMLGLALSRLRRRRGGRGTW